MIEHSDPQSPEESLRTATREYFRVANAFRELPDWKQRLARMEHPGTPLTFLAHWPWLAGPELLPWLIDVYVFGRTTDHLQADCILRAYSHEALRRHLPDLVGKLVPRFTVEWEIGWLVDLIVEIDCPSAMQLLVEYMAEHPQPEIRDFVAQLDLELKRTPGVWGRRWQPPVRPNAAS